MTPGAHRTCRVLAYEVADGPANMARDEALLDLAAREPATAALRTYGWSDATLSLGYFQAIDRARSDPRWRGVPLVRRPTGGGAIWHDRELTYALAIPAGHPLAREHRALYRAVHGAIAGLLRERGADARRRGEGPPPDDRPFLCFSDREDEDLVIDGRKIVGSAQRRRAGAILQHGSLLLGRSPRTPELPGLAELSPAPADPATWAELLGRRLPEALGFVAAPSGWPEEALTRARSLEADVYRQAAWTGKR